MSITNLMEFKKDTKVMAHKFAGKTFRLKPHIIQLYGYTREMQIHLVSAGVTVGDTSTSSSLGPTAYMAIEVGGEEKLKKFLDTWCYNRSIIELPSTEKTTKLFHIHDHNNAALFSLRTPSCWVLKEVTKNLEETDHVPYHELKSFIVPNLFINIK